MPAFDLPKICYGVVLDLYIYYLFTSQKVYIGKNCVCGLWVPPEAGTQDRGHSFPDTDRPRLVNNIFNFLKLIEMLSKVPELFKARSSIK